MTEPLPNCFSIWPSAATSAFLRLSSIREFPCAGERELMETELSAQCALYKYTAIRVFETLSILSHTVARIRRHCISSPLRGRLRLSMSTEIREASSARGHGVSSPLTPRNFAREREMRAEGFEIRSKSRGDQRVLQRVERARGGGRRTQLAVAQRIFGVSPVLERVESRWRPARRDAYRRDAGGDGDNASMRVFGHGAEEAQRERAGSRGNRAAIAAARRAARRASASARLHARVGLQREEQPQHRLRSHGGFRQRMLQQQISAYSTAWRRTASRSPSNWIRWRLAFEPSSP